MTSGPAGPPSSGSNINLTTISQIVIISAAIESARTCSKGLTQKIFPFEQSTEQIPKVKKKKKKLFSRNVIRLAQNNY